MHYDENDPRHPHYREMPHRRDQERRHPHQEHFNDFRSRWEEPEPLIHLNHQANRHRHDEGHPNDHAPRQQHSEDWHDPRHNRFEQHQDPVWRQQDVHFDRSNQRVEDRWNEGDAQMMPHPHHPRYHNPERGRPHPRDAYWDENEY
ncbi:hypothetical protein [uncultured Pontibacter sp.]|uniref:hypothetical protein n=1 Tax=uncultured Pontibacter sp. TaxID=453356 RepID=UPI00261F6273|nr:hypothetical protein [uncultured Pontibacter sp.]